MLGLRFERMWLELLCFGAAGASVILVVGLMHRRRHESPSDSEITISGDAGADISGYLATYLLPLLTVAKPSLRDVAAYATFVLVVGVIYVRSDMVQINPLVYLMGWKVLRATVPVAGGVSKEVFVFTRRDRRVGDSLQAERFADRVYIDHAAPR
jgi:hypothetical protein